MATFHPLVRRDASQGVRHYDSVSDSLGNEFWSKFEEICHRIEDHPERFHFDPSGWRRANLERFPYHILFYQELDGGRVMALRHNRQNPRFGLRRKWIPDFPASSSDSEKPDSNAEKLVQALTEQKQASMK